MNLQETVSGTHTYVHLYVQYFEQGSLSEKLKHSQTLPHSVCTSSCVSSHLILGVLPIGGEGAANGEP